LKWNKNSLQSRVETPRKVPRTPSCGAAFTICGSWSVVVHVLK